MLNSFGSLTSTCRQLTLPEPAERRAEEDGKATRPASLASCISSLRSSRNSAAREEISWRRSPPS